MRGKFVSLLIVMVMVSLPMQMFSEAQVSSTMNITMGGQQKSDIVAGIIHNVTITLNQATANLSLKAHLSSSFTVSNRTNNYSWSCVSDVWADNLYAYYIKSESGRYGSVYCFHIALDSTSATGTWLFTTYSDGIAISNQQIQVVAPVAGISMSAPRFYFQAFPYGTGFISSWKPDDIANSSSLTTKNIGNVPLNFQISYDSMNSLFATSNSTGTYNPSEERTHFVSFQAQSWSPRQFTVKGMVHGEPQLLMTPDTVSTIVAAQTTFDVVVTVARPGYNVYQMDGVTVQYKTFYSSAYRRTMAIDMFLTGNKSVYLGHDMENLTFNSFLNQGVKSSDDLLLVLQDNLEQQVIVNFTCSVAPPWKQPSMIAYANFDLRHADGTGTGRFTSNVVVSASAEAESEFTVATSVIVIIILIAVFIAIGMFLLRAYKKTEEDKRNELEEKIRRKKEKAKKQRRA